MCGLFYFSLCLIFLTIQGTKGEKDTLIFYVL